MFSGRDQWISMRKIEDPNKLTRECLAQQAFCWALSLIPLARQQQESEVKAILYGSICVYYSRPFTNNSGFGKISEKNVPEELMDIHNKVIEYRNKVIAHSDINDDVNRLFIRSDGKTACVENRHKAPTDDHLADVEVLIKSVLDVTKSRTLECLNGGDLSTTKMPKGLYRLSVGKPPVWLEPVEDDGLGDA